MRRSLKGVLGVGILGGAAYAAWRAWNARVPVRPTGLDWSTAPFPFPPAPRPSGGRTETAPTLAPVPGWAEPNDDGSCPVAFPIKAKLGSGIYHPPGGLNYARTKADRCYADPEAAEADGLRPSKV
jgi:hypothetical protein